MFEWLHLVIPELVHTLATWTCFYLELEYRVETSVLLFFKCGAYSTNFMGQFPWYNLVELDFTGWNLLGPFWHRSGPFASMSSQIFLIPKNGTLSVNFSKLKFLHSTPAVIYFTLATHLHTCRFDYFWWIMMRLNSQIFTYFYLLWYHLIPYWRL